MKLALIVLVPFLIPLNALAHAHLTKSDPASGATLTTAPSAVVIHFSENVEPRFSKIAVTSDSTHARVDHGAPALESGEKDVLRVELAPALAPGKYHVAWKATAVDTHKSHGSFDFTVAPASPKH